MKRKRKLYILIGAPGSGKSTWAKAQPNTVVLSSDDIRIEKFGTLDCQDKNKEVFQLLHNRLEYYTEYSDLNIIYDATNISQRRRKTIFEKYKSDLEVIAVVFNLTIDELLKNNNKREGLAVVPEHVIRRMIKDMQWPTVDIDCNSTIDVYNGVRTVKLNKKY